MTTTPIRRVFRLAILAFAAATLPGCQRPLYFFNPADLSFDQSQRDIAVLAQARVMEKIEAALVDAFLPESWRSPDPITFLDDPQADDLFKRTRSLRVRMLAEWRAGSAQVSGFETYDEATALIEEAEAFFLARGMVAAIESVGGPEAFDRPAWDFSSP